MLHGVGALKGEATGFGVSVARGATSANIRCPAVDAPMAAVAMRVRRHAGILLALASVGAPHAVPLPVAVPNDNRTAGGVLHSGALTLQLEAREGTWFPDGPSGPSLVMQVFAERGRPPQNPGPMIRVPAGTRIQLSLRNLLDSALTVYGLQAHPGPFGPSFIVAPGETVRSSFVAGTPGTYFYWGTTTHQAVEDRNGIDSQLHGAFIVDPPGRAPPRDRVFVLGSWTGPEDSTGLAAELRVINGRSWPQTERLAYTVGDTVRWRVVNPTDSPHPMHLHGFYFDVMSRGSWAADTIFSRETQPKVVTEMPLSGGTYSMMWVPEEPGNWLFHCHVAFHTSFYLSARPVPDPDDPMTMDPMHDMAAHMRGMVMGVVVRPGASTSRRPATVAGAQKIRLVAQGAPGRSYGRALDDLAYVKQDGAIPPSADSVPALSAPLILERGRPVRITVVNHLRAPTGVHWHGIEVPSYSDGVAGWSGSGARLAPAIAPGDSFTAAFTPTRSGTFIYHAHSNESFQVNLGLYGALLVVDPDRYDPGHERVIVLGGNGPGGRMARINGKVIPDTLHLTAGRTYRLRIIDIIADWTARIALMRDDSVVTWRSLAKDGAELPPGAQRTVPASFIAGPGETMDFEFRPAAPGIMRLAVEQRQGFWKTHLPIVVDR